jgi:hypothetical protein
MTTPYKPRIKLYHTTALGRYWSCRPYYGPAQKLFSQTPEDDRRYFLAMSFCRDLNRKQKRVML